MTDVLISQLPVASSVNTSDLIIVDQNISGVLTTKTATIAQLMGLPIIAPAVVANTISTNALDSLGYSAEFTSYDGVGAIVPNSSLALKSARGTITAPTATVSGDTVGNVDVFGNNGTAFAYTASIDVVAAANFTNINTPSNMVFNLTAPGTTTPAAVATLTGSGNFSTSTLASTGLDVNGYSEELVAYVGATATNASNAFKTSRGTISAPSATQANDLIGGSDYFGYGVASAYAASIDCQATATFTNVSTPTQFNINVTAPGATVPTPAVTIGQGIVVNTISPTFYVLSSLVNNNVANGTGIQLGGGRGTQAVPSAVLANDILGNIDFFGYGTSYVEGASINAIAKSLWSGANAETALTFNTTANGSIVATEKMRLDSMGTLLIGQTTGGVAGVSVNAATSYQSNATSGAGSYNFTGYGASAANTNNASMGLYSQTRGAVTATASGDTIGNVDVFGWTGAAYAYTASIDVVAASTFSGTNYQSSVVFNTTALNATAPVLVATLNNTGFTLQPGVQIVPATVAGIKGTVAADAAQAGSVGEVISSSVNAIATGLTTATPLSVTSIALTAGDWDVWGSYIITGAATTSATIAQAGINTVAATLPGSNLIAAVYTAPIVTGTIFSAGSVPIQRINVSTGTTVYLVALAAFTVSTAGAGGTLYARRVR